MTKLAFHTATLTLAFLLSSANARSLQQTCNLQTDRQDNIFYDIDIQLLTQSTPSCSDQDLQAIHSLLDAAVASSHVSADLGVVTMDGNACMPTSSTTSSSAAQNDNRNRNLQLQLNFNHYLGMNGIGKCHFCWDDPNRRRAKQLLPSNTANSPNKQLRGNIKPNRALTQTLCGCQMLDFTSANDETDYTSSHGVALTISDDSITFDFTNPVTLNTIHLTHQQIGAQITMHITTQDSDQLMVLSTTSDDQSAHNIHQSKVTSMAIVGSSSGAVEVDNMSFCHAACEDSQELFERSLPMMEAALSTALNDALSEGAGDIGCIADLGASIVVQLTESNSTATC